MKSLIPMHPRAVWTGVLMAAACIVLASDARADCPPVNAQVIDSEARCFPSGGLDIQYYGEDGIKVACMRDKRVESACGPDGRLTRQQAYHAWVAKLQQFQVHCESDGGVFSFDDPGFVEPNDESYCMAAQPEVGTNMFEDALCNFHSICPAIKVSCTYDCSARHAASHSSGPSGVTLK